MINCIKQMGRMVTSNRTLCRTCDKLLSEFRAKLTEVFGYEASLFGQGYFHKLREALLYEDHSIVQNICAYCQAESIKPGIMFAKARRTTKRGLSKTFSKRKTAMDNYAQYSAKTMCNVLQKIDHLKEASVLCYKCHTKTESSMKRVIPHYYRATLLNKLKVKNNALGIMDVYGTTLTLEERSAREEYQNQLTRCCVKCNSTITPICDMLQPSISESSCEVPYPVNHDNKKTYINTRNVNGDKEHYTTFETVYFSKSDAAKAKADNKRHLQSILRDINIALRGSFSCPSASCVKGIKELRWVFRELQIGWFRGHRVSLKQLDTNVMKYLQLYYSDKLADTLKKRLCFHCGAEKQILGGGGSKCDTNYKDGGTDTDGSSDPVGGKDDELRTDGGKDYDAVNNGAGDTDYENSSGEWDWVVTDEELDEAKPGKYEDYKTQLSDHGDGGNDRDETTRSDAPEKEGAEKEGAESEEAENESQQKMLERMTREDLKNMLESFTVTRMDQVDVKEVPDLQDEMYRLLRMDDKALDMEDGRMDLMCFPEIFSFGVGEKRASTDDREEKANPLQYEKTRLLSANGSSRRHANYLFHLSEECERRKIQQSIFSTMKNVPGLGQLNAGAILAKISQNDDKLLKNIDKVLRKVPNTKAYWKSVRVKLRAQIEKFGPPTFFITFSPAEYDWPGLITWLREQNADIPNVDQLSPAALLNIDPVLTSTYIHQRFNALWDFILKAEPLGKVVSWFIRHEYQTRGTVHFHCFVWADKSPILNKDKDEDVVNFIQKHATCRIPSASEETTLFNTVTRYQSHTCRPSYCIRSLGKRPKGSKGPRAACKFGFPRVKCKTFTLHSVLSCVIARKNNAMRKRLYDLARSEEERRINDYNDVLSFLWGANMDIQYLAESSHSISEYITKYITKPEEATLKDFKDDLSDKSKSVYQKYCSSAYKWMKQREMGAHEAADRILQNNGQMWRSSEKFEWLQATMPKKRSRTLRPLKDIKNQDPNSKNIFFDNWVDNLYPYRPKTAEFEQMSIFDFVLQFDKASLPANSTEGPTNTTKYQKIHDINTGKFIRTLQRRSKEPVLYHTYYNRHSHPEEFYYSMLFLHKNWRVEGDILGDSDTYQEEFFKAVELFPRLKEMSSKRLDIEKARDKLKEDAEQAPEAEAAEEPHSEEDNDEPQGISDYREINANSDIQTQEQLDEVVGSLNKQQIAIYYEVTQKLEQMVAHEKNGCNDDCAPDCKKPLLLYVSGFGGTGKSYLIRAIKGYMFVRKTDFSDPIDIALTAPTGLAARNISGQTLHSAFMFSVEHGKTAKYTELSSSRLQRVRHEFKNLKLMITDECSMISGQLLFSLYLRMQQIFPAPDGVKDEPFGGKCVILFGDLMQLPPVMGTKPFVSLSSDESHDLCGGIGTELDIWKMFQFRELTINQRQVGAKNLRWSGMLNRIRLGTQTQDDILLLQERLVPFKESELPKEYLDQLIDYFSKHANAVCLFPLRSMVNEFNQAYLNRYFSNAYTNIMAEDEVDGRTKRDKRKAQTAVDKLDALHDSKSTANLEKVISLCEGARIMLRKNLNTAKGLVNGAMGTVVELIRDHPEHPVKQLRIQFDCNPETFLVNREEGKREIFPGSFLRRRQFPVCLGYGLSIHKAQGMSLETVICDIGETVFATGQTYVALSRCKSLDGLHLINFSPSKIMVDTAAINEYLRLGSAPVCEAAEQLQSETKTRKRKSPVRETIWYTTKNAKKGKSTIDAAKDTIPTKGKGAKKPGSKAPPKNTTKTTKPAQTPSAKPTNPSAKPANPPAKPVKVPAKPPKLPAEPKQGKKVVAIRQPPPAAINGERCITRILDSLEQHNWVWDQLHSIISMEDLAKVYREVLEPWPPQHEQDTFMNRIAKCLDPDPFLIRRGCDKWLTDNIVTKYMSVMRDDNVEMGFPTVCNMGACGFSSMTGVYENTRRRGTRSADHRIAAYLDWQFNEVPFTRRRLI